MARRSPEAKRGTIAAVVLFLVAVVVLPPLLFVGSVAVGVYVATKGPRDRAHAFAKAVHDRKFEKAHGMLVDELRNEMDLQAFRKQMDGSQFSYAEDLFFHRVQVWNDSTACLDGTVNGVPVNFQLTKVRGSWRIRSTERGNRCQS